MDIARGVREARMDFISPWGESVRGALMKRLKEEMNAYDFVYSGTSKREKQKTELISEVINMPQLYNANPSVFAAALFVWTMHNRKFQTEVSDDTIDTLKSVLNRDGKPDNQLNEVELKYAIRANIIRYVYAIFNYVNGGYSQILSEEQAEREADEDLGEMDDEREDNYDEDF